MKKHIIKLELKSLDKKILDFFTKYLLIFLKNLNLSYISIFFLPKKKNRISILKSPHVNKKAIEQFQFTIFKSLLKIKSNNLSNLLLMLKYLVKNKFPFFKIKVSVFKDFV